MSNKILVYCAVPSLEIATMIAQTVVHEELAACVNVLPGLTSVYRWQGAVETANELLLLIKTREALFEALRARIVSLHPYEVPEIIATRISEGHAPYLEWIGHSTQRL
ncbi:MAG: divalent-cation tolerance protein CutA [Bryobacterales bacterium]|nr:divalent-cation tolerance protein CutA [Bryobacterales bacterium]